MKKIRKARRIGIGIVVILFFLAGMTTFLTQEKGYWTESTTRESVAATIASSDPNIQQIWNRTWGGPSGDTGISIWDDGTYLYTLGATASFGAGSHDLALLKWDTNGSILWNRTWGGLASDVGESIWSDGTYLYTLGYTASFGAGSFDFALLKWDTNGNILWNRTWGGLANDIGFSIWGDIRGNKIYLYTFGRTASFGTGGNDHAFVKWDKNGNILLNRTWGGPGDDRGYSIWGNENYLYTLGTTASFGAGSFDFALLKWHKNGNILWNYTWGGSDRDMGYSIWGNGTYLYTLGYTESFGAGSKDHAFVKWDINGTILWNYTWGGPIPGDEYGYSIWSNGGTYLYTLGRTNNFGAGSQDFALLKWDTDGNILWSQTWGGPAEDGGNSIWGNGTYLYTLGVTESFGPGSHDLALIKWECTD